MNKLLACFQLRCIIHLLFYALFFHSFGFKWNFIFGHKVVVLGGGSFGTAMAAHVADRKAQLEVNMLVRDAEVCQSINESHLNW